jgi:hypothetical protein
MLNVYRTISFMKPPPKTDLVVISVAEGCWPQTSQFASYQSTSVHVEKFLRNMIAKETWIGFPRGLAFWRWKAIAAPDPDDTVTEARRPELDL